MAIQRDFLISRPSSKPSKEWHIRHFFSTKKFQNSTCRLGACVATALYFWHHTTGLSRLAGISILLTFLCSYYSVSDCTFNKKTNFQFIFNVRLFFLCCCLAPSAFSPCFSKYFLDLQKISLDSDGKSMKSESGCSSIVALNTLLP